MKLPTFLFPFLSLLLAAAQPALAEAPFVRVFVLSGQSNMAGGNNPVALTGAAGDIWFDNSGATQDPATLQNGWLRLRTTTEGGDGVQAGAWPAPVPDGVDVVEEVIDPDLDGDGAAALIELRVRITGQRLFLSHRVAFE